MLGGTVPVDRVGRYEVLQEIGRGGMGVVYLAQDQETGTEVALKVIAPHLLDDGGEAFRRFQQEARAAAKVRHRNVVAVLDVGEADGQNYIALEYIRGESLSALLSRHPDGLPLTTAVRIGLDVAAGLAHAHDCGVVHRDIKPPNVLIDEQGVARITDFGIARESSRTTMTQTGLVIGTPSYMSPEQASGKRADARSDVYAMGIMLFEMLTGRVPFRGDDPMAVMFQHVEKAAPEVSTLRTEVPAPLARMVARCLHKDPERRFESASELRHYLDAVAIDLTPAPAWQRALRLLSRLSPRAKRRLAYAALIFLGFMSGFLWLERITRPEPTAPVRAPEGVATSAAGTTATRTVSQRDEPVRLPSGPPPVQPAPGASLASSRGKTSPRSPAPAVSRPGAPAPSPGRVVAATAPISPGRTPSRTAARSTTPSTTRTAPRTAPTSNAPAAAAAPSGPLPARIVSPKDSSPMVLVPAGSFVMGQSGGPEDEGPPHEVNLPAFYIDEHEVSVGQFRKFVSEMGYRPEGQGWDMFSGPFGDDAPVVQVTWNDAEAYARWAGRRLPTEQEWEKAARGNAAVLWPWGNSFDKVRANWGDYDNLTRKWGVQDRYEKASPVGAISGDQNSLGLKDLAGNVMEWTSGWYDRYPGNGNSNPYYGTTLRVVRGGCWEDRAPEDLRVARRRGLRPHQASPSVGFRTVADPGS